HQGERPREDAIGVEALGAGPGDVPDAGDLSPAMIVARANDHQVATLGEPDDLTTQIRRKAQRFGSAIHDLEPIDAGDRERAQLLCVIAPLFWKRRDAQPPLMLDGAEDSDHACRGLAETVARPRLDGAARYDVMAIDAPLVRATQARPRSASGASPSTPPPRARRRAAGSRRPTPIRPEKG